MISRRLIVGSGAVLAALGSAAGAQGLEPAPVHEDWDAYLARTRTDALARIRADRDDIGGYLHFIAAALTARRDIPRARVDVVPWASPSIEFGAHPMAAPFALIEFRLAPGAYLPPHNHPNASVATLLLEGETAVDNFELEPTSDPPGQVGEAVLAHTQRQLLRPGDTNFVQPSRNNLHAFVAGPNGARGVDVTTQHAQAGPFGYLRLLEPPQVGAIVRAQWADPSVDRLAPP